MKAAVVQRVALVLYPNRPSAKELAHAASLVAGKNGFLVWGLFGPWLWIYLAIGALIYAWYSLPHLRRLLSRKRKLAGATTELTGIV